MTLLHSVRCGCFVLRSLLPVCFYVSAHHTIEWSKEMLERITEDVNFLYNVAYYYSERVQSGEATDHEYEYEDFLWYELSEYSWYGSITSDTIEEAKKHLKDIECTFASGDRELAKNLHNEISQLANFICRDMRKLSEMCIEVSRHEYRVMSMHRFIY